MSDTIELLYSPARQLKRGSELLDTGEAFVGVLFKCLHYYLFKCRRDIQTFVVQRMWNSKLMLHR